MADNVQQTQRELDVTADAWNAMAEAVRLMFDHLEQTLANVEKHDPYAPKPLPKWSFDMLVTDALCVCCRSDLPRGTLIYNKPIKNMSATQPVCGPCASRELLPLWDEQETRRGK